MNHWLLLFGLTILLGCDSAKPPIVGQGVDSGSSIDSGESIYQEPSGCIPLDSNEAMVSLDLFRDDSAGSCGGEGEPDVAMSWTAPETGRYVFTAAGGEANIVKEPFESGTSWFHELNLAPSMYLLEGACVGNELHCSPWNVQLEEGNLNRGVVALQEGQTVTVVLEAAPERDFDAGFHYEVSLQITSVTCIEDELDVEVGVPVQRQLAGIGSTIGPVSCAMFPDRTTTETSWGFTAPAAGRYMFSLHERYDYPVVVAAFTDDCMQEIACTGGPDGTATLEMELEAGQRIAVVGGAEVSGDTDYGLQLEITKLE